MTAPVNAPAANAAPVGAGPASPKRGHRGLGWIAVLVITFSAVIGSNVFGIRDYFFASATPDAETPAFGRHATDPPAAGVNTRPTSVRSQPWWQDVVTLQGAGATTTAAFTIRPEASHWRVTGNCRTGQIVARAPGLTRPVVDSACSGNVLGGADATGSMTLDITADGPWTLTVAQLIDLPLAEPPTAGMTAPGSKAIAKGEFYNVGRTGTGKVTVYEEATGYSVRLDDFYVSPNSDLQLRFSTVAHPRRTADYLSGKSQIIADMDVTAGSLNYSVPSGGDPTLYKSVVVWSPSAKSAYVAASLGVVR